MRDPDWKACLVGLIAALGFVLAFFSAAGGRTLLSYLGNSWRGWDDLAIASSFFRTGAFPTAPYEIGNDYVRRGPEWQAFNQTVQEHFRDLSLSSFGATLDAEELISTQVHPVTRVDDAGRAFFLGLFYQATQAIRPLAIVWIPVTFVALMLGWAAFELYLAGRPVAAVGFATLVSLSSYFREASGRTYAAYGFYLAAGLGLIAFSVAASHVRAPGRAACRLAVALGALCVAVCARSGTFLMVPGYMAAWVWGATGSAAGGRGWIWRLGPLLALLAIPQLALRSLDAYSAASLKSWRPTNWPAFEPAGHDIWPTLWIGLGDFDRTKGHVYSDESARLAALSAGHSERISPGADAFFRKEILNDLKNDPSWLAGILANRVRTTFFLDKIWPTRRWSGQSYRPAAHPNEGAFDSYMALVPEVDRFGWGRFAFEVPGFALWLSWPALLLTAIRSRSDAVTWIRILSPALLGLMMTPVVITTASAVEMQAVGGLHMLVWVLVADVAVRDWTRRRRGAPPIGLPAR